MNAGIEKRRNPRIPLWWPVILRSPTGPILGTLRNISVSGALISCSEPIENNNELLVILKSPKGHELAINCKKVWSEKKFAGNSDYNTIGFIFTKISSSIKNFIASLVAEQSPAWISKTGWCILKPVTALLSLRLSFPDHGTVTNMMGHWKKLRYFIVNVSNLDTWMDES